MSDKYQAFTQSSIGKLLVKNLGLPQPTKLERYTAGDPLVKGTVLTGGRGRLADELAGLLDQLGIASTTSRTDGEKYKALVFDATGITDSTQLDELWRFFHPTVRRVKGCGRVVVIGTQPELTANAKEATAQRALEGFTRALGKEIRKGSAVNLIYVEPGAEDQIDSTLRFFISSRSAYVSGQVARIVKSIGGDTPEID